MSYIQFERVKKSFGNVEIIKNFTLDIEQGQFVSLLGPSGCGKTTCLRMLAGLEKNTGGEIKIQGTVLSSPDKNIFVPPENRHFGMVFQSYAVWPHMTVFENIAFPLKIKKMPVQEIKTQVMEILEIVEMAHLTDRMPDQLSGGQQQRVALARGLVMKPKALLLDEPLSNLDAKLREKMRNDIKKIQKSLHLTMVFVTHDQTEAKTMSDLVVIMDKGEVIQKGSVEEIYRNPKNEFVRDFLN